MSRVINITEPSFDESEVDAVRACLDSKWVTQGPLTAEFEAQIAAACAAPHAVATTSCTAALHLAACALDLKPGDEVLVPAFTWVTSAFSAEYVGATPRFVDIDPHTLNLDPASLEAACGPRTRAIVAVHLFGLAAPMREILAFAKARGLSVIEDAACALGTTYNDGPVGVLGDLGCFSFHPRKIVTTGEGGAITTASDELAARLRVLRNHGASGPPDNDPDGQGPWTMAKFDALGFNLRLSDIQAAIGVAQMRKLDALLADRRRFANGYFERLVDFDAFAPPSRDAGHTYQSFVIRLLEGGRERRNRIMSAMAEAGVMTRPGTHAVHRLGYFREKYGLRPDDFPNAAAAEDLTITLPILPHMSAAEQDRVLEALRKGVSKVK